MDFAQQMLAAGARLDIARARSRELLAHLKQRERERPSAAHTLAAGTRIETKPGPLIRHNCRFRVTTVT